MKLKSTSKTKWVLAAVLGAISLSALNNNAYTYPFGAPGGVSGAPGEGNCSDCHGGGNSTAIAKITTNVDTSGYIPGKTYNISATVADSSCLMFGFEASPKAKTSGKASGTLINSNTSQTATASSNHLTHTQGSINTTTHSKTWTFEWTAPIAGSGTVGIYGSFLAANGDNSTGGDVVKVASSLIKENVAATAGIAIEGASAGKMGVYPNPAHQTLNYSVIAAHAGKAIVRLTNIVGQIVGAQEEVEIANGTNLLNKDVSNLPVGLYLLTVNTNGTTYVQKVLIE